MSKIGEKPIHLPKQATVRKEGNKIIVEGLKGKLEVELPEEIKMQQKGEKIFFVNEKGKRYRKTRALHGLVRSLTANAVIGVTQGFIRELELSGIGYKAEVKGDKLVLNLGLSHPIDKAVPSGLQVSVEKNTIKIEGIDKALVGKFAAEVRALKKPEPYKGKGIKYKEEIVRRKVGKAAKAMTAE